jgi:hypothetical protein
MYFVYIYIYIYIYIYVWSLGSSIFMNMGTKNCIFINVTPWQMYCSRTQTLPNVSQVHAVTENSFAHSCVHGKYFGYCDHVTLFPPQFGYENFSLMWLQKKIIIIFPFAMVNACILANNVTTENYFVILAIENNFPSSCSYERLFSSLMWIS